MEKSKFFQSANLFALLLTAWMIKKKESGSNPVKWAEQTEAGEITSSPRPP